MSARPSRAHRGVAFCLTLAALLTAPSDARARPGDPDPGFGSSGIVTTPVGSGDERALGVLVLPSGQILAAGWTHNGADKDVVLALHDATGVLVPTFGVGGIVTTPVGTGDDVAEAVVADAADRPVIAGWTTNGTTTDVLLVRYDGGVPDPTFGTAGIVRTPIPGGGQAFAIATYRDGFVVAGRAGDDLLVARYDGNGQLDDSFGIDGTVITPVGGPAAAMAVTRLGSSNVVVAGWVRRGADADFVLARYDGDGDLVSSFGDDAVDDGIIVASLGTGDDVAEAIVEDAGRLLVAGWSQGTAGDEVVLANYRGSGVLRSAFGTGGIVRRAIGNDARALALAVERDGRVFAGGWTSSGGARDLLLLRHSSNGAPDTGFGTDGVVTEPIGSDAAAAAVTIQGDGRSVIAGHTSNGADDDLLLARHLGTPRCGNGLVETEVGETCDDLGTRTGDCCSPTCRFDPPGAACARDADACTEDHCDGAGTCIHPSVAAACDAHLCYRSRSVVAVSSTSMALASALGESTVSVRRPQALCLPGMVDGVAVDDPTLFQEAYRLRGVKRRGTIPVRVSDRFGTLRLRMRAGDRLLLPTRVQLDAPPPGPPPPGAANAFQCHRVTPEPGTPALPAVLEATVGDAFGSGHYELRRPARLCVPADANGSEIAVLNEYLLCYRVRSAAGPGADVGGTLYTANALGAGRVNTNHAKELCVPALAEPCDTLPPCVPLGGQSADCTYDPLVVDPTHPLCQGPTIAVDATHANFHTLETDGVAGRYWGFARLLSRDGYVVTQSDVTSEALLQGGGPDVLVIANPTTDLIGGTEAVPPDEVLAIADWVRDGGSLLLVIDHSPFERVGLLLAAFGIERLPDGTAPTFTFTRDTGTLNGASTVAAGPGPDTAVDQVTTFTGTAFRIAASPPAEAQLEPVLVFPAGVTGASGVDSVDLDGYLQGVTIRFGAGRVYVAGEAGGLSAQTTFGMQLTPENERFLRNILWWLTQ